MSSSVEIVEDTFGILLEDPENPKTIQRFTLTNETGLSVQLITFGAAMTSLKIPDKNGQVDDIVLGFDDMEGYTGPQNAYFGAAIGRLANRVANAQFTLDGQDYQLSVNDQGVNSLHGGFKGFDKVVWEAHIIEGKGVTFSYASPDTEEGYPGNLLAFVTYTLTPDTNELAVRYQAMVTKRCPVALTNHSYFNLSGHQNADKGLVGHLVHLNADAYTPVDAILIPTGEIKDVTGTEFDFRVSKNITDLIQQFPEGFDHNFCINGESGGALPRLVARIEEVNNGRVMEILSDQPGLQFYTGNFLPPFDAEPVTGKEGALYFINGALALETQNYPNAINQPNFPNPVLNPGDTYSHQALFRFSVVK